MNMLLYLLWAGLAWCIFTLVRNQCVWHVRSSLIEGHDFLSVYRRLPGYYRMVFDPRYWSRWSINAWREYVKAQ